MDTKVYKMYDSWVWSCDGHEIPIAMQVFSPREYRDPWCAALFDATRHSERFHDRPWHEPEEI